MNQDWINALLGGVIIGGAVSLMLLLNGRVTGISGIINGVLSPVKGDTGWRVLFVLGLVLGGFAVRAMNPEVFSGQLDTGLGSTVIAGLLVGFGTVMGSGCTSGHGVCGISRLSPRSLVATMAFIAAGMLAVVLFKSLGILS
ncbi:MAG TPA: YeeE/YedE family protein [Oligoflexus sp.]|uniref:YeeE/YedE family protein n=1 Tax=Oligoflexus sp. TaxID=1971216 RepID=UPI002D7E2FE3|nr:YeeE/YedE family protein [Oligoflexus sp.]HET9236359.1 YeeE/YedE family protein [Oligoflexus sp.]